MACATLALGYTSSGVAYATLGCLFTDELESCNFVSISICGIDHFGSDWIFFVIKTKDLEYRSGQNWCTTSC